MEIPENYRLFKFKNGEDVIAEFFESPEDKNHLILRRPMQIQIMMSFDKSGNPVPKKLIMTEWLPFSHGDTAIVQRDSILCYGKPTGLICGVYDNEKKRIDTLRANGDMETPPPNELDKSGKSGKGGKGVKGDEELASEAKVQERKAKKRAKMIFIQMSLSTLMRFLETIGLDVEDEPWKSMVNPSDSDEEEDDDDDEDEEDQPRNLDGRMDIMPDVDGDGWVDPFGNPWNDDDPT